MKQCLHEYGNQNYLQKEAYKKIHCQTKRLHISPCFFLLLWIPKNRLRQILTCLPSSQFSPLYPELQAQEPMMQIPRPSHCGSMHCVAPSHSVPFQPLKHRQRPWSTGRCHHTAPDRLLWNKARQGDYQPFPSRFAQSSSSSSLEQAVCHFSTPRPPTFFPVLGVSWMTHVSTAYLSWLKKKTHVAYLLNNPDPEILENNGRFQKHTPFPWQFLGHSTTDSEEKKEVILAMHPASCAR